MTARTIGRLLAGAALVSTLALAGCSSDGGSKADDATEYCAAVKDLAAVSQQIQDGTAPPDAADQVGDLLAKASAAAPDEVKGSFASSLNGDVYAREDVDLFNQRTCDIDTRMVGSSTVTTATP